jgi:hypothetical protein
MFSFPLIQAHDHPDIFVKFVLFSLPVLRFSGMIWKFLTALQSIESLDTLIEAKKLQVVSNKPVILVSEFFMNVFLNRKFCFRGLPCNA